MTLLGYLLGPETGTHTKRKFYKGRPSFKNDPQKNVDRGRIEQFSHSAKAGDHFIEYR